MRKIKTVLASFLFISLFILSGCKSETKGASVPVSSDKMCSQSESDNKKLFQKGDNYEIFEISMQDEKAYEYTIYDNNKNVMDTGKTINRPSEISPVRNNVIKNYQLLGMSAYQTRYYDVANKKTSPWYPSAVAETTEKVAYLDYTVGTTKVYVKDIFDDNSQVKEYSVGQLSADEIVTDAKFDNGKLVLVYEKVGTTEQKTITIVLAE